MKGLSVATAVVATTIIALSSVAYVAADVSPGTKQGAACEWGFFDGKVIKQKDCLTGFACTVKAPQLKTACCEIFNIHCKE
ncbi:hypothetical protein GQ42DRAFT_162517 [Ramicandelaber brevisporus]|nr:hypothetical protein GQ42DRAFT_162517 [Ramicandelaber brevisporus]